MRYILLGLLFLVSCGSEKSQLISIVGDGNFYCGLQENKQAKCWRYIVARDIKGQVIAGKPIVLDKLSLPSQLASASFDQLIMRYNSKKIPRTLDQDSWVRICGIKAGQAPACWQYHTWRAEVSLFDLSTMGDFSQASVFDFGMTDYIKIPANLSPDTDTQASLFCYVSTLTDKKVTCHDWNSQTKLEFTAPNKITHLSVGGAVCAADVANYITCAALELTNNKPQLLPNVSQNITSPISTLKVFPQVEINGIKLVPGCVINNTKQVTCVAANLDTSLTNIIISPLSLAPDLISKQVNYINHDYVIGDDQKLIKIKFNSSNNITQDIKLPTEIASKFYLGWAAGKNSACGLERDSKEVSCYEIVGTIAKSLPAP